MKSRVLFPCAALLGGAAGLVLRLAQNRTGFDAEGLPVPGDLPSLALPIVLAALAALLLALTRALPKDGKRSFPAAFSAGTAGALTLVISGVFLMAISGVLELLSGAAGWRYATESGVSFIAASGRLSAIVGLIAGLLSLLCAVCLFLAAAACRRGGDRFPGSLLLIPVICLVVRLVLVYRTVSADPVLGDYYIELLALSALIMGFYRLSAFAVDAGQTRRLAFYAGAAAMLALTLAADGVGASLALYLGGAAVLLGFLLLRLQTGDTAAAESPIPEFTSEDPAPPKASEEAPPL